MTLQDKAREHARLTGDRDAGEMDMHAYRSFMAGADAALEAVAPASGWHQVGCGLCSKPVTTPIPKSVIVRAFTVCPECLDLLAADVFEQWAQKAREARGEGVRYE